MLRSSPLRSKKPMRKSRKGVRPGRLKGQALADLRLACYMRDKSECQECGRCTLYGAHHLKDWSYHMAHIKAKRMGGDSLENVRTLCGACHRKEHAYGKSMTKPVPRKDAA